MKSNSIRVIAVGRAKDTTTDSLHDHKNGVVSDVSLIVIVLYVGVNVACP